MRGIHAGVPAIGVSTPSIQGIEAERVDASFEALLGFLERQVKAIRSDLSSCMERVHAEWISWSIRSKDGFTKEQAKKLFYSFRQRKREGTQQVPEPDNPDDTEARFEKIMIYMEETSRKLDRIESDIEFLKEQVANILKRL